MGIADKLKEYAAQKYVFEFPDGEKLTLRPVRAVEIIPRLGVAPDAVGKFLTGGGDIEAGAVDPADVPQAALLAGRLEEAYFVYGITNVDLCFSHEALDGGCENATTVESFKAWVRDTYGEGVLTALERKLHEVSGEIRAEEVAQDRESFREVDASPALHGEDVRDEPARSADAPAG